LSELNNPPLLIATTLGTEAAFVLAFLAGRASWAAAVPMASPPAALNVFVITSQNEAWVEQASVAVAIGTFASVWFIRSGRLTFP
jgi:hypothetical protein